MHFDEFIKYTPKIAKEVVSFKDSHAKMTPSIRNSLMEKMDLSTLNPNKAAVMMLFYPKNDEVYLVLIERASYNGIHASQIAFPGGKPEKEDGGLMHTALRETHEEIGIHPSKIEVVRAFAEVYIPPSNYMVYPFMGISRTELNFKPQQEEVASIVELPLKTFLSDDILVVKLISTSYADNIDVPGFQLNHNFIWGATAMMLSELKDTLKKVI